MNAICGKPKVSSFRLIKYGIPKPRSWGGYGIFSSFQSKLISIGAYTARGNFPRGKNACIFRAESCFFKGIFLMLLNETSFVSNLMMSTIIQNQVSEVGKTTLRFLFWRVGFSKLSSKNSAPTELAKSHCKFLG